MQAEKKTPLDIGIVRPTSSLHNAPVQLRHIFVCCRVNEGPPPPPFNTFLVFVIAIDGRTRSASDWELAGSSPASYCGGLEHAWLHHFTQHERAGRVARPGPVLYLYVVLGGLWASSAPRVEIREITKKVSLFSENMEKKRPLVSEEDSYLGEYLCSHQAIFKELQRDPSEP